MTVSITLRNSGLKSKVNYILLVAYIFLYLFFPPLISLNTLYLLAAFAYFYFFMHIKQAEKYFFNSYTLMIYGSLLFMFAYYMVITYVNGMKDAEIFRDFFYYMCLFIPICLFIVCRFNSMNFSNEDVTKTLLIVGNLQGIFCVISFLFAPFHDFVLSRLVNYGFDEARYSNLSKYRLYGFAFHMTNYMPMVLAILAVIAIYKARSDRKYIKYVPLLFVGVFLNSRSSLLLLIAGMIVIVLFSVKNPKMFLKIMAICMVIACIGIFVLKMFIMESDSWFAGWIRTGVESIESLFGGKKTSYFSYISSESVWQLPEGLNLIVGNGTRSGPIHFTDVGFVNYIRLGGIVYIAFIIFYMLNMARPLFRKNRFEFVMIFVAFAIMNIKDTLFTGNEYMCLVFLLCFIAGLKQSNFIQGKICEIVKS